MDGYFDPTYESACLLATGMEPSKRATEMQNLRCILEDASSPVTRKHQEKLGNVKPTVGSIQLEPFGLLPETFSRQIEKLLSVTISLGC